MELAPGVDARESRLLTTGSSILQPLSSRDRRQADVHQQADVNSG